MNKKIFVTSLIVLALDQISKAIIAANITLSESITIIKNFFYLTYHNNYGAAWGYFNNQTIILIVASLLALIIIYKYMYTFKQNIRNTIALGLLVGGITGNLIDRFIFGCVRDFLDFYIFGYDFPIFNISDLSIVIGVILLVVAIIKGEDKNASSSK